ncbi:MAG TPA: class I SAM-dependent methyltransferase [Roseiflexaceae bacterium]|nr:class I SAM-dependent methyltransferase [Roseiflexaceae bacterium]
MTTSTMDQPTSEAFAERLVGMLNEGALCLMISIGHRTALFDAMATLPPVTSEELAAAANLNERYVREWLSALTTGGIITYDPVTRSFHLPAEHAAWLTRAAAPNNIAVAAQYIPLLSSVEEGIIERFRTGGGLHYHEYPRFHAVMAEDSGQTVVGALFDYILPLVPDLTQQLETGIDVLDLGCGEGRALIELAAAFPHSRFTGYDLSAAALAAGREAAQRRGLTNLHYAAIDAAHLDETARYDLIVTFDAIHDQADPARVLANIRRALRPNGVYLMQDIRGSSVLERNLDHPLAPFMYTISTMHCMSVSLAAGGAGLGTMWGEELAQTMLADAGFSNVQIEYLAHDFQNSYYIARV